jgi:beta-1,2-mannobiose phosphorylase / 1,2-beta-oligomannan phosphorylase
MRFETIVYVPRRRACDHYRSLICTLAWLLLLAALEPPCRAADEEFPDELVRFTPYRNNPVFEGAGEGHWDRRIRERGWILKEGDSWRMWYTGYDGTSDGKRMLGLATSPDGFNWIRSKDNPIYTEHWVEDMQVVRHGERFYMFAEGLTDQAQLLESNDGVKWQRIGQLDVRLKNGEAIPPGPYGTPTAFFNDERWFLFYERSDRGVWLATSTDMRVWRNVQDEPVLSPGPDEYDRDMIALNQVIKQGGHFYGYYHGAAKRAAGSATLWSTAAAMSDDLIHWKKYPGNPLLPVSQNKSSGILVHDGQKLRLYTMHNQVDAHLTAGKPAKEKAGP